MSGFVFDALVVLTPPGVPGVDFQRPVGPLEHGHLTDPRHWAPAADPLRLDIANFGIDALGQPYYDPDGAAPGERATLWIDPNINPYAFPFRAVWLEAA